MNLPENKSSENVQEDLQPIEARDGETRWQQINRCFWSPWYRLISVEPTMFLYMLAFMITSVVEQDFFLQKACRVNNNFTDEICDHLNDQDEEYKKQVQRTVARFHLWENIAGHIFPIVLALFLGSFSDRRGRKLPLILGLVGKLVYSVMIVVNARMTTWPVEYIIYTAVLPSALTGADVAIFASCFAYIADVSTLYNRTMRITILDVCYLSAMPIGVALGSYLYANVLGRSVANMFTVNASLLAAAIIYSLVVLKWQTTDKQRPLRELGACGIWSDFFDKNHVRDSFKVLARRRPGNRRIYLALLMIAMGLYTFQRDENPYLYMYTKFKFDWTVEIFSTFKTFKSSAYVIAMLLGVPLMNKCFGWRDTTIIFIGTWAHAIARVFYYFAESGRIFYVGAVICSLGPIVGPMIRAMTSKIVPQSERGKVFALLSVCDNAVPFISGVCYSQVYQATLDTKGDGIYLLTIATQMAVFVMILWIHFSLGERLLEVYEHSESDLLDDEPGQPIVDNRDAAVATISNDRGN